MADKVSVCINEILQSLSPMSAEVCIFRVPNFVREVNKKAYEPQLVAIGPYHDHGKDHLKAMETHKIHYLQLLLQENGENDVSKYVAKLKELEEKVRKCYAEPVSLDSDEFVKMMLLDGCFIIQLIHMTLEEELRDRNDLIYKIESLRSAVLWDMLLVENQLPFFLLWELNSMFKSCDQDSFKETVFEVFGCILPFKLFPSGVRKPIEEINHLLDFIHNCLDHDPMNSCGNMDQSDSWSYIRCATELQEAGMNFKVDEGNGLLDVKFESGIINIPLVVVHDGTEGLLRNLVAFEQLQPEQVRRPLTDFIVFMDCLIDSPKDVEILRQHGIIENLLGDNEAVSNMFNRLGHNVTFSKSNFYFSKVFNQMEDYCNRYKRLKTWIAYLKRNYFNSP